MKTTPFQDVLHDVAGLLGLEPEDSDASNFDRFQAAAITRHINRHVRRAWMYFPWPELEVIEERHFRDTWVGGGITADDTETTVDSTTAWTADSTGEGSNYPEGSEVWHEATEAYYVAIADCTSGDIPGVSACWELLGSFSRHVALEQTGQGVIAEALDAWQEDPTTNDSPRQVPFTINVNGVQFPATYTGNSVWLKYRIGAEKFTSTPWSAQSYSGGARVYDPDSGECYAATGATAASDVPRTAAVWREIPMPYCISAYVVQAAYADALREDGQHDRARGELALAREYLDDAMAQVVITQGQTERYQVITSRPAGRASSTTSTSTAATPTPTPTSTTFDSTETTFDSSTTTFDAA